MVLLREVDRVVVALRVGAGDQDAAVGEQDALGVVVVVLATMEKRWRTGLLGS